MGLHTFSDTTILNLNITTFPLCFCTRWNMNYKLSDDTKKINKRTFDRFQPNKCPLHIKLKVKAMGSV